MTRMRDAACDISIGRIIVGGQIDGAFWRVSMTQRGDGQQSEAERRELRQSMRQHMQELEGELAGEFDLWHGIA